MVGHRCQAVDIDLRVIMSLCWAKTKAVVLEYVNSVIMLSEDEGGGFGVRQQQVGKLILSD